MRWAPRVGTLRRMRKLLGILVLLVSAGGPATAAETLQPTVVLVHGAWADGSSWDRVIPLLQAKGLRVVAVQNPMTSLADDVAATQRVIASQLGPVVLVGHSWAGTVITEAGTDPKVAALVYVAAFAPDVGQSINDLGKGGPAPPGLSAVRPDGTGFLYLTANGVSKDFAQDLPVGQSNVMASTQGPISAKAFDEKVGRAAWKTKPSWYVVAENDRMIQPELERTMAKKIGARTTSLPSSHVVMLSHPNEVAAVILNAAASVKPTKAVNP